MERVDPTLPSTDLAPDLADTAIELGAIYRSCAVINDDAAEAVVGAPEQPSGTPGTRLPHGWIEKGGARLSTLDLGGDGFLLLAGPDGQAWLATAERQGLTGHAIREPDVLTAVGVTPEGALLVRPDGVIGWRSRGADADPGPTLAEAVRRLSGR